MGRFEVRLSRLEKVAIAQPTMRESYATVAFTESLEAAIEAAERGTELSILEIDPFSLKASTWTDLALAMQEAGFAVNR